MTDWLNQNERADRIITAYVVAVWLALVPLLGWDIWIIQTRAQDRLRKLGRDVTRGQVHQHARWQGHPLDLGTFEDHA